MGFTPIPLKFKEIFMMISINELKNGYVVKILDDFKVLINEFVETRIEALELVEKYINSECIHELKLRTEGAGLQ